MSLNFQQVVANNNLVYKLYKKNEVAVSSVSATSHVELEKCDDNLRSPVIMLKY